MSRDSLEFLRDIEESRERILEYTEGLSQDEVFREKMRFDGLLYNLHVIGEAVKHLPESIRTDHGDIPWKEISGMRDIIAHAYFALDLDILWKGIKEDVPTLLHRVQTIIEENNPG